MEQLTLTQNPKTKRKLTKLQSYMFYFFVFSFCGWVLEILFSYVVLGHFTNRGFFYGPICPIYGCGGIMLLTFLNKRKSNPVKFFIISVAVFSVFEYAISYGLDALYNMYLWDYTNEFLNINGRICLIYSLAWGLIAIVFVYLVIPMLKKIGSFITNKIPVGLQVFFIKLFSIIFFMDVLYSFIEYSHI